MAQNHIIKLENVLRDSLNEIDKLYTRKIQGDMHRCSAKCCDKSNESLENVYGCIRQCSTDFEKVQRYLQAEYTQFESRLQRCILQCTDSIVDNMGSNPSASEMAKFNQDYESCVITCANKHIDLVPGFLKRVKGILSTKGYMTLHLDDDPKSLQQPTLLASDKN